jgi:hypothetical protein
MVNGAPAPARVVEQHQAQTPADVKAVAATADAGPASQTPPAPLPPVTTHANGVAPGPGGAVAFDGPSAGGVNYNGDPVPERHYWGRAEYLVWWLKNQQLGPVLGTIPDKDAALGDLPPGDITPLFGGHNINDGALSGVRLELGVGLDAAGDWGISGEFFQLEHAVQGASLQSNAFGSPAGGPVFSDPVIGKQVIVLFADPGVTRGNVAAATENRLWGFELDARCRLSAIFADRLDFILGYRHIGFDESLDQNGSGTFISGVPSPSATISFQDHFGVHNNFDGAVIGLESEYDVGCLFLDLRGKFGLGNIHEEWTINGSTNFVSTLPGIPSQTVNGGVLAQPSNSGSFSRNRIDFLGEITVNGGVRLFNDHVKAYIGYNFLGLSKILRPGLLVDDVNSLTVPSLQGMSRSLAVASPAPRADDGRFWAEGLNFGLSFEY